MGLTEQPRLLVLAGVNGAGKSTLGGHLLRRHGLQWYNPDGYARALFEQTKLSQEAASSAAWHEGVRRLTLAMETRQHFALETTLGGTTLPALLRQACDSHQLLMWYCGLASPQLHLARVHGRLVRGGHAIPADKIQARWHSARANLIALMPHLAALEVLDNSQEAGADGSIPQPKRVLSMRQAQLRYPLADDVDALAATPEWAKPLLEAALRISPPA